MHNLPTEILAGGRNVAIYDHSLAGVLYQLSETRRGETADLVALVTVHWMHTKREVVTSRR